MPASVEEKKEAGYAGPVPLSPRACRGAATITPPPPTLIYDNDCRLCQAALDWAAKTGALNGLTIRGQTDLSEADLQTYAITRARCAEEVILITPEATKGGAEAILAVLSRANHPLANLARLAPIRAVAPPIYRAIARNRRLISALILRKPR